MEQVIQLALTDQLVENPINLKAKKTSASKK
jgi:hypothetical protein